MKKFTLGLLSIILLGLVACEPEPEPEQEYHDGTGMYLGITTFNDEVYYYEENIWGSYGAYHYGILDQWTVNNYVEFINNSATAKATLLYYAVDKTLSYLEKCQFPDDVESVSVITFTDGLDKGSHGQTDAYGDDNEKYLAALNSKINNIRVNGLPINAYTIGVRGNDVYDIDQFQNNLRSLASSEENVVEVSNIDEVNAKFKAIAESLYKKHESRSLRIKIPRPQKNESQRFTFDLNSTSTDATHSTCYLEGVYADNQLQDIKYVGCASSSGVSVQAIPDEDNKVYVIFQFENFGDAAGNAISTVNMRHWYMAQGQTTWSPNTEFTPAQDAIPIVEQKSAVVTLILDCSSSLGEDFVKVQEAACNFIRTLAGGISNGDDNGNNNGNDNPELTSQIRFCKQYAYTHWPTLGCADANNNIVAYHEFGAASGTSPYYDIAAGKYRPCGYYYNEEDADSDYWVLVDDEYSTFEAGKKYTFTLTDDGEYMDGYITLDGSMNAPAQIVKQWKTPKSSMTKWSKH